MKWSLRKAATEFGTNVATLTRGLRVGGVEVVRGKTYTTRQVFTALAGDLQFERMRESRARADLLELDKLERQGELVPLAVAESVVRESLLPLRQILLALPASVAGRCNPSDPQLPREALESWVDQALRSMRDEISRPDLAHQPPENVGALDLG